ncbi:MAG: 1-(5-phosphoribosyl)-5-[(5-phosphoribosylamino)methylideneamino]imidazole-4-carboxamide isomerase, partial [Prolixibacteraceae bacterium]|nr:1-(5-phosphoribosyl)-5-[(5-phosphoribosylamino)methylideneamino]imidazole-4-carboxamide isomerase [Prolixibacteraceae bacterium]
KIILGADAKDGKIAVSGWRETSELTLIKFIESYIKHGINKVISTDISRDGMMTGANTELYVEIQKHFPDLEIIASGGISCMDDILKLDEMGIRDVIVGKAIYEKKISMEDISGFYKNY